MKKLYMFFVVAVLAVMLCSCVFSEKTSTYTVEKNNTVFTVDTKESTISDGTNTYRYQLSKNDLGYKVEITYPNGSTYWWRETENVGHGGWSDDYDVMQYVNGDILCEVLEERVAKPVISKNFLFIFLLAGVGAFNAVCPQNAWYLAYGWRYKGAEPSDVALGVHRLMGVVAVIAALVMIIA